VSPAQASRCRVFIATASLSPSLQTPTSAEDHHSHCVSLLVLAGVHAMGGVPISEGADVVLERAMCSKSEPQMQNQSLP
jgi:hypothetical protein